ncbi:AMP-binding protein [Allosphingosinicella indica]|uniref:Anthranilate--CoA ligase n=1 Tax=Allosphingosinicella indica TaxID=941907 RepID=A0A1X7GIJ6_9SPHN|nr:AMP-binding protein [Allosphingosinicella indica]SMF70251.1 anthranilate--CoA ligase [Allosphingosinicella indica]
MYDSFVADRLPPADAQPEFLFDLPELRYPDRLNAAVELIDRAVAEGDGDRPAVVNAQGRWTYADLKDMSDRIARLLVEEEGLLPGNRVFLRGPNGATLFAAWLGILKAGGIVVATMPILRPGEIATILKRAEISHAIVDSRFIGDFRLGADEAGTVRSLLRYDGDHGKGELETRIATVEPGFTPVDTGGEDPALIAFTSGTTGIPKGCVHFHRDILAPCDAFAAHLLDPRPGDVWLTSAPIAFTFGLGATLLFPFRFRGCAATLEQATPPAMLDAIETHKVTSLFTAPTAYKTIIGQLGGRDISSLRTCVSAGEHLPKATWEAWQRATGLEIIDGIGSTELMHIFISASGGDIRPGFTGKAVPGYRACVLGEDDRPLPAGNTGRLAVKGPTGCRYFDDDRQAKYVIAGWNVTGDTYEQTEDGYFRYVARSDDMIISSGYNIGAPEVENALLSHPAVQECAVIGVACAERGQKVKAFVVLAPGHAAGDDQARTLQDHTKAMIAPYKYPREITFVEVLPKTANGKLQRFALRA